MIIPIIYSSALLILGQGGKLPFKVPSALKEASSSSNDLEGRWSFSARSMLLQVSWYAVKPDTKNLIERLRTMERNSPERVKHVTFKGGDIWIWWSDWRNRPDSEKFVLSGFSRKGNQVLFADWEAASPLNVTEAGDFEVMMRSFRWRN